MKYLLAILLLFFTLSVKAETISGSVGFDWVVTSQNNRNDLIEEYKSKVMTPSRSLDYSKEEQINKRKDADFVQTQTLLKTGVEETEDKIFVGFYKFNMLLAYGIIEKTNLRNTYYYNALGNLVYMDVMEKDYGTYPNIIYQYGRDGKLVGRIYSTSKYDQFMYDKNGVFIGRWYENKMYDKKGKETASRSWF